MLFRWFGMGCWKLFEKHYFTCHTKIEVLAKPLVWTGPWIKPAAANLPATNCNIATSQHYPRCCSDIRIFWSTKSTISTIWVSGQNKIDIKISLSLIRLMKKLTLNFFDIFFSWNSIDCIWYDKRQNSRVCLPWRHFWIAHASFWHGSLLLLDIPPTNFPLYSLMLLINPTASLQAPQSCHDDRD